MKKILLLIIAATMFTAFSVRTNKSSMTISITHVEKITDGNKVFFEIVSDVPSPYVPALLVSTSYNKKTGMYDWGGNPFPHEMVTVGNVTTGYFIDAPFKGGRARYYKIMDWDADGNLVYSPVYNY